MPTKPACGSAVPPCTPGERNWTHAPRSSTRRTARCMSTAPPTRPSVTIPSPSTPTADMRDAVRANRLAIAAVHAEIATVYDQLVTAEPSLAEEHRTRSDWHRNASEQARGYADLLND